MGRPVGLILAVTVPLVVLGNALVILLGPWTGDVLYALPGFPADILGLDGEDRANLAESGIRSIWPVGEGTVLLEQARLPNGTPAFEPREISHMEDVSALVKAATVVWLAALVTGLAALIALRKIAPGRVRPSLGLGARIALFSMLGLGIVMATGFEFFFDGFHAIFFEGDSWQFADGSTLRRLYPDEFWGIVAGLFALFALAQAIVLSHLTTGLPRPFRWTRAQADQ